MAYFKVEDTLAFHPKVLRAGNAAMGLWVRAGAYCTQQLTDGRVPEDMIRTLGGTAADAQRLVDAGLWERDRGGFVFHEWAESGRNWTRAQVESRRKADRRRQQKHRTVTKRTTSKGGGDDD